MYYHVKMLCMFIVMHCTRTASFPSAESSQFNVITFKTINNCGGKINVNQEK